MLRIQELSKSFPNPYGEPSTIFSNLSIDIQDGDFVSIIGSNGTGKSTLLNIISGVLDEISVCYTDDFLLLDHIIDRVFC